MGAKRTRGTKSSYRQTVLAVPNNNRDLMKYESVQGNVLWSPVRYTAGPYSQKKDARNIFVFTESAVRNRPREIFRLIFTDVICHNTRVSLTRVCSLTEACATKTNSYV